MATDNMAGTSSEESLDVVAAGELLIEKIKNVKGICDAYFESIKKDSEWFVSSYPIDDYPSTFLSIIALTKKVQDEYLPPLFEKVNEIMGKYKDGILAFDSYRKVEQQSKQALDDADKKIQAILDGGF